MFKLIMLAICRASPRELTEPELTVKGLMEGVPYEFRVAAVNEAGPGEWAEVDEAIKPAPPPCESHLDMCMHNECRIWVMNA